MDDTISRQGAINVADKYLDADGCNGSDVAQDIIADLMVLPSAEPQERKIGRWIHREDMDFLDKNNVEHIHFMCSECGLIHDFLDGHISQYNYCPQCGARMEVEHE